MEAEYVCTVKLTDVYDRVMSGKKMEGDITDPATVALQREGTKFVLGKKPQIF